jgi:hypothetical protein
MIVASKTQASIDGVLCHLTAAHLIPQEEKSQEVMPKNPGGHQGKCKQS